MKDPKFGYHWIWLVPVACIYSAVATVYIKRESLNHKRRMRKIRKNKEIDDLLKLAGN